MPLNEEQFIRWACELYGLDYSTAKNGVSFALDDLSKEQQAVLSSQVDEDTVINDIVNNLDNKLSSEELEVKGLFENENSLERQQAQRL